MNMASKNKKYIGAAIAGIGSGIVYLIMQQAVTNYFFDKKNNQ